MLFTGLGRSALGETVPSVWVRPRASGGTQDIGHRIKVFKLFCLDIFDPLVGFLLKQLFLLSLIH